jgi:hypothetical protein
MHSTLSNAIHETKKKQFYNDSSMDLIMGTIHSNGKSAELRIFVNIFPVMELHEPKSNSIAIASKKNSVHGLAEQHKESTSQITNDNTGQVPNPTLEPNVRKHKHEIPSARIPIDVVHGGACLCANERTNE